LDVSGDLHIPKKRLWEFNARVKATQFPWTYVKELVAEIESDSEPTAKNLPVKEMDILTADLDVSTTIITYPFDFNALTIRNSRVVFSSPNSKNLSIEKLNVSIEKLQFIHPENSGALTGIKSTKGTLELMELKVPGLNPLNVNMNVTGENDTLNIDFSSITQKAKSETGRLLMDISKKEIVYVLQYTVKDASLEYFIKKFYNKKLMKGSIDYLLDLRAAGATWAQVKQSLSGTIEITGDSLLVYGMDIDDILRKYEKSQNFNLTDLGAVLVAGPVGLAVTKGSDFVSLATINLDSTQRTRIKKLLTKWRLENQQLITEDVALATAMNRIAFNGRIDFATDSIPGLTVAVVDKNGCSLMDQKLYGKTSALKTGKLNITKTLLGSVINFAKAVVGKDCKPVYTGKVKAH
jgi:AsmA protein